MWRHCLSSWGPTQGGLWFLVAAHVDAMFSRRDAGTFGCWCCAVALVNRGGQVPVLRRLNRFVANDHVTHSHAGRRDQFDAVIRQAATAGVRFVDVGAVDFYGSADICEDWVHATPEYCRRIAQIDRPNAQDLKDDAMAQPAWGATKPRPPPVPGLVCSPPVRRCPAVRTGAKPDAAGATPAGRAYYGGQAAATSPLPTAPRSRALRRAMKAGAPQQDPARPARSARVASSPRRSNQPKRLRPRRQPPGSSARPGAHHPPDPGRPAMDARDRARLGRQAVERSPGQQVELGRHRQEVGWDAQTVDALFSKYGYGKTPGTLSPGQPLPSGAS